MHTGVDQPGNDRHFLLCIVQLPVDLCAVGKRLPDQPAVFEQRFPIRDQSADRFLERFLDPVFCQMGRPASVLALEFAVALPDDALIPIRAVPDL